jgi:putative transposase
MVDFKGSHYPKDVILYAVFFYVRYAVSCRNLEEIMAERGVNLDHATLNRWVVKYSPLIALRAKRRKSKPGGSWRMDETYIKVKGKWVYFHRAVDKHGKTLDFMLSEHRDESAATDFFARTIENNGWPEKVVIDKSGANLAGLQNMNFLLLLHGWFWLIEVLQVKYLNNMIEQDHRFIKKLTPNGMGNHLRWKSVATIKRITGKSGHAARSHILIDGRLTLRCPSSTWRAAACFWAMGARHSFRSSRPRCRRALLSSSPVVSYATGWCAWRSGWRGAPTMRLPRSC